MRALKVKDLGLFSKIVAKMDIKGQIHDVFVSIDGEGKSHAELAVARENAEQQIGINLIMLLIENYHKAESDVHELLAGLNDITVEEVEALPLADMVGMLKDLQNDDSFSAFFGLVTD